jgi:thiol-disulfide isomerase/thioredoxin
MRWNQRKLRFALPFIVLFVSVVGGWALSRSSDDVDANLTNPGVVQTPGIGTNAPSSGKTFPFTELIDIATGNTTTPATNGTPMVINFWFSTCEPCKREMPALTTAAQLYAGAVNFVGINPNDTRTSATAFLEKYNVDFSNYLDDGDQLAAAGVVNMPTTLFVNGEGKIVATHAGEITLAEIEKKINKYFGIAS